MSGVARVRSIGDVSNHGGSDTAAKDRREQGFESLTPAIAISFAAPASQGKAPRNGGDKRRGSSGSHRDSNSVLGCNRRPRRQWRSLTVSHARPCTGIVPDGNRVATQRGTIQRAVAMFQHIRTSAAGLQHPWPINPLNGSRTRHSTPRLIRGNSPRRLIPSKSTGLDVCGKNVHESADFRRIPQDLRQP